MFVHGLDWPTWVFVLALVVSGVVLVFWRVLGLLLVAVVLLAGLDWSLPGWFLVLFWVLWAITLIAQFFWVWARWLAAALVLALVGMLFASVVVARSEASYVADLQQQLNAANAKVDAVASKAGNDLTVAVDNQSKRDNAQDQNISKLQDQVASLDARLGKVEKRVSALETRVGKIEGGITATHSPKDLTTHQTAEAIAKALPDWKGKIKVGEVDWNKNPNDPGTHVFHARITSTQELSSFLNGSSAASKAERQQLKSALRGYPASEYQRALRGEGFVPVQFTENVCYHGNGLLVNGQFVRGGEVCHTAGDIMWVYVASDGKVVIDASVRADCGNIGSTRPPTPKPTTPTSPRSTPPATRSTTPPTSHTTPPTSHTTPPTSTTCTRPPSPGKGWVPSGPCGWKKSQSAFCLLNPQDPSCPQPAAGQDPQHNPGQPTGGSSGAPTTAPALPPSQTVAPGGSSGTVTQPPSTGTPTCDPSLGCGSTHTAPAPTTVG